MTARRVTWLGLACAVALGAAAAIGGCGGGDDNGAGPGGGGPDAGDEGSPSFGDGSTANVQSITIDPANASIESVDGAKVTQAFKVVAHYADGSNGTVAQNVTWNATNPQVGALDATGLFTANGSVGGGVRISATFGGHNASAQLNVKLHLHQNGAVAPQTAMTALENASNPDPTTTWSYPYDGTVWPRGLLAPTLMWNMSKPGAATDIYYVHMVSPTFELDDFELAKNDRIPVDNTLWQRFTDSTAGDAAITVARFDGAAATVVAKQKWTIAPASMRGTIYYWSNNRGRVLRIKPGAAQPDDFAYQPPLNDPGSFKQASCLMTCHTVSADGSTLVSGGGTYGGSYDLKGGKAMKSLGGTWGPLDGTPSSSSVVKWMMPAVSPTGKYILTNSMGYGLAYANDNTTQPFLGLYTTADGQAVASSGLMNVPLTQPTWSPDGTKIAFVGNPDPVSGGWAGSWNNPPPGDLQVISFDETKNPMAGAPTTLVAAGGDATKRIAWPTISPDGKWIVYSRAAGADTRAGNGDLYFASATKPNLEMRMGNIDGDGYPFAAGQRDLGWNFEPSFAPVAAGGYFWVVFTSRRTYGNVLTDVAEPVSDPNNPANNKMGTKQLWVAAIDQDPAKGGEFPLLGQDPSHPAFHLTGQDEQNLAMRGFWALDPCKGDGQGCQSGTECCGGYCDESGGGADGGGPVCKSQSTGCAADGDKCNADGDCCSAATGTTCINHVCSEPAPK